MMRFKLLLLLGFFLSHTAAAEVYKCTDANGKTSYQAKPCASGEKGVEINFKTGEAIDKQTERAREALKLKKQKLQESLKHDEARKRHQLIRAAKAESEKNQTLVRKQSDHFSAYAIPPYNPENPSDLVKQFEDRLPEIERMRRMAALKVLSGNHCKRVEASELNIRSTKDQLIFLVNCSRGQGIYVSEDELKKPENPTTNQ